MKKIKQTEKLTIQNKYNRTLSVSVYSSNDSIVSILVIINNLSESVKSDCISGSWRKYQVVKLVTFRLSTALIIVILSWSDAFAANRRNISERGVVVSIQCYTEDAKTLKTLCEVHMAAYVKIISTASPAIIRLLKLRGLGIV